MIFSLVLNFEDFGKLPHEFSKVFSRRVFEKMVSNLAVLEDIYEAKFQGWFFVFCSEFFFKGFLIYNLPLC